MHNERRMLCQTGLVHVSAVDVLGLDLVRVRLRVDDHRHVAILRRGISQIVQHAALLILQRLPAVAVGAHVRERLPQGHVRQP